MGVVPKLAGRMKQHRSGLFYAASNSVIQITVLLCQFLSLKFVSPEHIGIWQAAMVIEVYLMISQLGVVSALCRE